MTTAGALVGQPPLDHRLPLAGAHQALIRVVAKQISHRTADLDQLGRVVEKIEIRLVPGYQAHFSIHHANPLAHVLQRPGKY